MAGKRNLTVQLDRQTIRKAKILAAKRGTFVSGLIRSQIQGCGGMDDAYEAARRTALEFLEHGFHLGGERLDRDALHER